MVGSGEKNPEQYLGNLQFEGIGFLFYVLKLMQSLVLGLYDLQGA